MLTQLAKSSAVAFCRGLLGLQGWRGVPTVAVLRIGRATDKHRRRNIPGVDTSRTREASRYPASEPV
eukprot:6489611-Pyramimonas_sp.AAC.1